MNIYEIKKTIIEGAKDRKVLSLVYLEKDGTNDGPRFVEPYSMRDAGTGKEGFFAFDLQKDGIRRFTLSRIISVEVTSKTYSPRNGWSVEF